MNWYYPKISISFNFTLNIIQEITYVSDETSMFSSFEEMYA